MHELEGNVDDFGQRRVAMVAEQLRARGIRDERVLGAMLAVPRQCFVPAQQSARAYDDRALPIGFGQTISQPYMVAIMLAALVLQGRERVLDVGTGSGYQAALLGRLTQLVYSVEIVPELAAHARNALEALHFDNVKVVMGNGTLGLPQAGPFDAIVVAAGAPDVPSQLTSQLAEGGTLVIPVGGYTHQELVRVRNERGVFTREPLTPCTFVPLVGEQAWGRKRHTPAAPSS